MLFITFMAMFFQSKCQTTTLNGFYITIDNKTKCTNLIPTFVGEYRYCLSEEPIINATEIESVSAVRLSSIPNQKIMTLKFSENGFRIWKGILNNLPNAQLVLAIDGYVVATFKNDGRHDHNVIPITSSSESMELEWIYERLKK